MISATPRSRLAARIKRGARGSMLLLCIAMLAVILAVTGCGFGVYFIFFSHKLLENCAEDFALETAQQLNCNDHAGKLNNLLGHSRELVFSSREIYSRTTRDEEFNDLEQMAAQVLEQSRQGAKLLTEERQHYVDASLANLRNIIVESKARPSRGVFLTNLSACEPEITDFSVGTPDNAVSNVESSTGVPELLAFDQCHGYIKSGKALDLYKADVNLKLPGADADLDFELSPLPAPVKGSSAPMRLSSGQSFKSLLVLRDKGQDTPGKCRLVPSMVQVSMTMKVKEDVVGKYEAKTRTLNTACAPGACQEP